MAREGKRVRDLGSIFFGAALAIVLGACVAEPVASSGPSRATDSSSSVTRANSATAAASADVCSEIEASADYCRRLANWMRKQMGLAADVPLSLVQLPPPTCGESHDGEQILCTTSGMRPRTIRATAPTGASLDQTLPCGGIPSSAICYEQPPLHAGAMGGYWDVPCSGEDSNGNPAGCAVRPVPDASAVAKSRPLVIDRLDHPVGAVGHHEDEIGTAILPNGILSKAHLALANADQVQHGFIIDPMDVRLQVEPTDPTRPPFDNGYDRGRFPGVEKVRVVLVYDVVENPTDAVLHFLNIEVR